MDRKMTYKDAGVDISLASQVKQDMTAALAPRDDRILNRLGAFASLFEADFPGIERPVLVLKAEEPGSKQTIALNHGRARSIAFDLVGHLVNDIIVMGARPLAVLDTIVCGRLEPAVVLELVQGIADACSEADCSLVGGETSEQPGVLKERDYVLCASILGVVDKSRIIDGRATQVGDDVIALPSNGLHTNGYSLVRQLIDKEPSILGQQIEGEDFLDVILRPHTCYHQTLKGLLGEPALHGAAHITGGGLVGNLSRIIPPGMQANLDLGRIRIPSVFDCIRRAGNVPEDDMLATFNLGVGMALVVEQAMSQSIIDRLAEQGCVAYKIGAVDRGDSGVVTSGALDW